MRKDFLAKAGITEEQFAEAKEGWKNSPQSKDRKYLATPEGKLMNAIYGG